MILENVLLSMSRDRKFAYEYTYARVYCQKVTARENTDDFVRGSSMFSWLYDRFYYTMHSTISVSRKEFQWNVNYCC